MKLTIIQIKDEDAAEQAQKVVEEFRVMVLSWEHDPVKKELHLTLDGPDANYTLRNKLATVGVRPDIVTSAYTGRNR